ncbi:MAG TPA: hypothetical protein VK530_18390 [Candidatus Acidoferrum sp.]|nr:hypothetical protein [Candidatus Acidoferrum sp.]
MTLTETLSCLRHIQAQWCDTDIPLDKLAALEAACLVETRSQPAPTVRLTPTGLRCKNIADSHYTGSSQARMANAKPFRIRQKRHVTQAQALV